MRAAAEKEDSEDAKRHTQWSRASQNEQKGQFNKLMHLVEQSKVFASIMQQRMEQEENKRQQKTEAERRKMERQEEQAENAAKGDMRRATRGQNTRTASPTKGKDGREVNGKEQKVEKSLPLRGRGRPKKGEKKEGNISSWLKKEDIDKKAGGVSVSQAVAEAAEEYDEEKSGTFGAQHLKSANQPAAVTGGIMRSYQLEGLYWLRSLYENGLNGILGK